MVQRWILGDYYDKMKITKRVERIKRKTKRKLRKAAKFRDKTVDNIDYYFEEDAKNAREFQPRFRRKITF